MACPIKTHPKFKQLANQVGEHLAIYTWKAYGEAYPKMHTNAKLREVMSISYKAFEFQFPAIAHKVRVYNKKHGTAHSFTPVRIAESTRYDLQFNPNYLPVNIEKQRLRDLKKYPPSDRLIDVNNPIATKQVYGVSITEDLDTTPKVDILGPNQYMVSGEIYPTYSEALQALNVEDIDIYDDYVVDADSPVSDVPLTIMTDLANLYPTNEIIEYLYGRSSKTMNKDNFATEVKKLFNDSRATGSHTVDEILNMLNCL